MRLLSITILFGTLVGWLDLTNTEVQVTVGALLFAGFMVGLMRPSHAWLWASILGFSVPAAQAIALLTGFRPPYPYGWDTVLEAFLAFMPAFVGTYGGILARWCWCSRASSGAFRPR